MALKLAVEHFLFVVPQHFIYVMEKLQFFVPNFFALRFLMDKVQTKIHLSIMIVQNKKTEHQLKLNLLPVQDSASPSLCFNYVLCT